MAIDAHARTNRLQASLLIAALVALVGLCGLLFAGPTGLLLAAVAVLFVVGATSQRATAVVMRMYRAQPLDRANAPELTQLFDALVRRAEVRRPQLYYVPSKTMNAFAIGHGEDASVAITAGLLARLNPRELAGVLAHELAHVKNNDVFVMSLADGLSRITTVLGQAGQLMALLSLPAVFLGYDFPWLATAVLFFAPGISALLQLALSRSREHNADLGAVRITGDPLGLASALARLEHLHGRWYDRILRPGRGESQPALLRTHPSTPERIARLNELAGGALATTLPQPPAYRTRVTHPPLAPPRWRMLGLWY